VLGVDAGQVMAAAFFTWRCLVASLVSGGVSDDGALSIEELACYRSGW
jgi:hypothetical protein